MNRQHGKIIIAGAGPGDKDLITLKLKRALTNADVVLYDYLIPVSILSYCRVDALMVSVGKSGKEGSAHKFLQEEIHRLMIFHAKEGKVVLRLKGGDPFIFGRGSEECELCVTHNISFEIIPGVSSTIAGPAYAGIPLTHRGQSRSVAIATGHLQKGDESDDLVIPEADTIVYVMAIKNLAMIVRKFLDKGYAPETPCALIERACSPLQRTFTTYLNDVCRVRDENKVEPPALFIIGEVTQFHQSLNWYEQQSLFGKTIVVTRTQSQAPQMVSALSDLGADVIEYPVIAIDPIDSAKEAIGQPGFFEGFTDIIFTSVNGIDIFFNILFELDLDSRILSKATITAIGKMSAERLLDYGIKADNVPEIYSAEGILDQLENDLGGRNFLLPRAKGARVILPQEILQRGGTLSEVHLYEAKLPEERQPLGGKHLDGICFTSTSTVVHFSKINDHLKDVPVFAIGDITARSAREHGYKTIYVSQEATIESVIQKLTEVLSA